VQTREFLDALNLSDVNEALNWTVGATTTPDDGGGQLFGGTGSSTIRGVGANAVNRNFFTGGSNPSTYNLERMDYARGPNSMLFGTGTISGTANAVVKSRRIGRNATELRAEYRLMEFISRHPRHEHLTARPRRRPRGHDVAGHPDLARLGAHQRKGVSPSLAFDLTRRTRLDRDRRLLRAESDRGHERFDRHLLRLGRKDRLLRPPALHPAQPIGLRRQPPIRDQHLGGLARLGPPVTGQDAQLHRDDADDLFLRPTRRQWSHDRQRFKPRLQRRTAARHV
jgi:hypothetical protein